jgi:hypothetical protein
VGTGLLRVGTSRHDLSCVGRAELVMAQSDDLHSEQADDNAAGIGDSTQGTIPGGRVGAGGIRRAGRLIRCATGNVFGHAWTNGHAGLVSVDTLITVLAVGFPPTFQYLPTASPKTRGANTLCSLALGGLSVAVTHPCPYHQ